MRKYKIFAAVAIASVVTCIGCTDSDNGNSKPTVAVSIPPLASIVKAIGGSGITVMSVVEKSTDPETFEPTVSQRMKLTDADLFFTVGTLPFEKKLYENLQSDGSRVRVVDVASGIEKIHGTHVHQRNDGSVVVHDDEDPHVWSSLRCAKTMAMKIAEVMGETFPDSVKIYNERTLAFVAQLDSADRAIVKKLSDLPAVKAFVIWHPSLSYFARDYSLDQISIGAENKESTPEKIRNAIDQARSSGAQVMFLQSGMDSRIAESVSKNTEFRICTFNPMAEDFITELIRTADEIAFR